MTHSVQFTLMDYNGEKSNTTIYTGPITAVNITSHLTEVGQMRTALQGITLGTVHKERIVMDDTLLSNTTPTNMFAQVELSWLGTYRDNVTAKIGTIGFATANPTGRLQPRSDEADLTETNMAAFKTQFEDFFREPETGNQVTLLKMTLVGRKR